MSEDIVQHATNLQGHKHAMGVQEYIKQTTEAYLSLQHHNK
jgi:hypothetical protein